MKIPIKKLHPDAQLPAYAHGPTEDAGLDLRSMERVVLQPGIAQAALDSGISYFDLTEDRQTTALIRSLAQSAKAGQVFMPQCGLAPGFVSIAAHHLTRGFQSLDTVRMRVGALPQFPN